MQPPDAGAYELNTHSCWQMLDNGARVLDGRQWSAGNIDTGYQASDPCNGYISDS